MYIKIQHMHGQNTVKIAYIEYRSQVTRTPGSCSIGPGFDFSP